MSTEEDAICELNARIQRRFSHDDIRDIYRIIHFLIITINSTSLYNVYISIMPLIRTVGPLFTPTVPMSRSIFMKSNEHYTIKRRNMRGAIPLSVGIVSFHSHFLILFCSYCLRFLQSWTIFVKDCSAIG